MYYRLKTGKIISDADVSIAFEITRGKSSSDDPDAFLKWKNWLGLTPIDDETADIRYFVASGAEVFAMKLYRNRNNCSVLDAVHAINKIKEELHLVEYVDVKGR